jgi:2-polyprenyl-3-methyl-5-hydroxy-6-metoxy-1,4-benzoquinol methylase
MEKVKAITDNEAVITEAQAKLCPLPYTTYLPPLLKDYLDRLTDKSSVLEIGSGEGAFLYSIYKYLQQRKTKPYVAGIDIDKNKVEHAGKYLPFKDIELFHGDAVHLQKVYGRRYDLIIAYHVIEHIEDQKQLLDNIRQAMDKDSILYVTSVLKKPYAVWIHRKDGKFVLDPTHYIEYEDPEQYYRVFTSNGFKIDQVSITQFHLPLTMFMEKALLSFGLVTEDKIRSWQINSPLYNWFQKIRLPAPGYKMIHAAVKI